jgi:hypothetical protein
MGFETGRLRRDGRLVDKLLMGVVESPLCNLIQVSQVEIVKALGMKRQSVVPDDLPPGSASLLPLILLLRPD